MFAVKIHSVDFPQPLHTAIAGDNSSNLRPAELRGVAHLFRELASSSATTAVDCNTSLLFVVAVPNYLSSDDFLLLCGKHVSHFSEILFLRNDGMEDRYSVLIRLENQLAADGFYRSFNGKRFKPSEAEVCHIYFAQSAEYTELAEIASEPPTGFTELPTCPICLERLDQDTSGIPSTLCDHSFHCSCVSKWTYLSCQVCRLCQQQDEKPACAVCGTFKNLWVCLICGFVGCGRYEKGHASGHWSDTQHHFSLELEKQQIWDYVGDKYVHRLNQSKTDSKLVTVHSHCNSAGGECGPCGCDEESGLDGALYSSKVEGIVDEYNHLLASQLKIQRHNYESLLAEARSRKESSMVKAVEKAIFSMTHELQQQLETYAEEKKAVADRNEDLMRKQELLQKQLKGIEQREKSSLHSRTERIIDLEEQVRDLKIYVEAQKKLSNMKDSDEIKGGTLLPVESNHSSTGSSKRRTKLARRQN